jgi:hypothetical protein
LVDGGHVVNPLISTKAIAALKETRIGVRKGWRNCEHKDGAADDPWASPGGEGIEYLMTAYKPAKKEQRSGKTVGAPRTIDGRGPPGRKDAGRNYNKYYIRSRTLRGHETRKLHPTSIVLGYNILNTNKKIFSRHSPEGGCDGNRANTDTVRSHTFVSIFPIVCWLLGLMFPGIEW